MLPLGSPPRFHCPAADQLLASKRNKDLLEPYEEREAAAVGYMRMINPGATVVAGPLTDPKASGGAGRRCPARPGGWAAGAANQLPAALRLGFSRGCVAPCLARPTRPLANMPRLPAASLVLCRRRSRRCARWTPSLMPSWCRRRRCRGRTPSTRRGCGHAPQRGGGLQDCLHAALWRTGLLAVDTHCAGLSCPS